MHAYKILLTAISGILFVASCGNSSKKVESLITQRDQARSQLKLTQDNYIQQNKELTAIMEELNVLSGKTLSLQLNIEDEHNPMSQAELMDESIKVLKNKLDELEKLADDDENILDLKGKRNKLSGMSYKASIYEKSLLFYQMAAKEGHRASQSRYSIIRNKIAKMK